MPFVNHTMLAHQWPLVDVGNQKPLWQGEEMYLSGADHGKNPSIA
jgi:hypothetical protein